MCQTPTTNSGTFSSMSQDVPARIQQPESQVKCITFRVGFHHVAGGSLPGLFGHLLGYGLLSFECFPQGRIHGITTLRSHWILSRAGRFKRTGRFKIQFLNRKTWSMLQFFLDSNGIVIFVHEYQKIRTKCGHNDNSI